MVAERVAERSPLGGWIVVLVTLAGCTTFADTTLREASGGGGAGTSGSEGGVGAAGGAAGGVPADPTAFLPVLDAAHVCALIGECPALGRSLVASTGLPLVGLAEDATDFRFSACVEWLTAPLAEGRIGFAQQQEMLFCVAASSCEGALGCLPVEVLAEGDDRCPVGDTTSRCEGGARIDCALRAVVDCGPPLFGPGSSCVAIDEANARCGFDAGCDEPSRCDESFAVTCDPSTGVLGAFDCASQGLACGTGGESGGCVTEEGPRVCAPEELGRTTCSADGERAYTCAGVLPAQIDCDAFGASCQVAGLSARCSAPGESCSPYEVGVDTCEGATLRACVGGTPMAIDCRALGRTCAPATDGPTGSLSGRCRRGGG